MSHRNRNENRVRKDPNKLAKHTKKHIPKTIYRRPQGEVNQYIKELNEGGDNDILS